jgi:hypothetical protein
VDWTEVTAITTGLLAIATFVLAYFAWRGIVENKQLISATKREVDLLWANAVPYLIPESVDGLPISVTAKGGRLRISYAAGTIPARSVVAWVGLGEVPAHIWHSGHRVRRCQRRAGYIQVTQAGD